MPVEPVLRARGSSSTLASSDSVEPFAGRAAGTRSPCGGSGSRRRSPRAAPSALEVVGDVAVERDAGFVAVAREPLAERLRVGGRIHVGVVEVARPDLSTPCRRGRARAQRAARRASDSRSALLSHHFAPELERQLSAYDELSAAIHRCAARRTLDPHQEGVQVLGLDEAVAPAALEHSRSIPNGREHLELEIVFAPIGAAGGEDAEADTPRSFAFGSARGAVRASAPRPRAGACAERRLVWRGRRGRARCAGERDRARAARGAPRAPSWVRTARCAREGPRQARHREVSGDGGGGQPRAESPAPGARFGPATPGGRLPTRVGLLRRGIRRPASRRRSTRAAARAPRRSWASSPSATGSTRASASSVSVGCGAHGATFTIGTGGGAGGGTTGLAAAEAAASGRSGFGSPARGIGSGLGIGTRLAGRLRLRRRPARPPALAWARAAEEAAAARVRRSARARALAAESAPARAPARPPAPAWARCASRSSSTSSRSRAARANTSQPADDDRRRGARRVRRAATAARRAERHGRDTEM